MFSSTVIEAPFRVLLLDVTSNAEGFEWEVSSRLLSVLDKRGVELASSEPLIVDAADSLGRHTEALSAATCVVVLGSDHGPPGRCLAVWDAVGASVTGPRLGVACQWGARDEKLSEAVLRAPDPWAPIAIAQETPVSPRDGALFLLKFLAEMDLHSDDRMTGRMAWFSWKKADELIKRRRMAVRFGLRT